MKYENLLSKVTMWNVIFCKRLIVIIPHKTVESINASQTLLSFVSRWKWNLISSLSRCKNQFLSYNDNIIFCSISYWLIWSKWGKTFLSLFFDRKKFVRKFEEFFFYSSSSYFRQKEGHCGGVEQGLHSWIFMTQS